jgi:short subunit dehydrogenase-like uncharacterized protein
MLAAATTELLPRSSTGRMHADDEPTNSSASAQLLILYTSISPSRTIKRNQQAALDILQSLHIPHSILDGADPLFKHVRDDLFVLTTPATSDGDHHDDDATAEEGSSTYTYPQFFITTIPSEIDYWGDWEKFQRAHEAGSLLKELGVLVTTTGLASSSTTPTGTSKESSESPHQTSNELSSHISGSDETAALRSSLDESLLPDLQVAASSAAALRTRDSIETDITVYGATSFVAQHVLRYLMQVSLSFAYPLRITLAGRSSVKLLALCEKLEQAMTQLPGDSQRQAIAGQVVFDVVVAEASDAAALIRMASRTKCVLNCAGPFAQYSSQVVAACAKTGCDYVDITGEVSWAGAMRAKYGHLSKQSGARIVNCCGFDSIPSDLAVWACVNELRVSRRKKNDAAISNGSGNGDDGVDIQRATVWHYCYGQANGGTIQTMLDIPVSIDSFLHPVPYLLDDPLVLVHPNVRQNTNIQSTRNRLAMGEWLNQLPCFETIFHLGVSIPFFMAIANAKVVHASSIALGYGSQFTYRERFLPVGFAFTRKLGPLSIVPAMLALVGILFGFIVLKLPLLASFLAHRFAPPGSGMTDQACKKGKTEVYALVESIPDSDGSTDRADCHIKFEGDPGNWATAQCVAESALCLVLSKEKLPARSDDGFGTPAELLGRALLERLQASTVRPVMIQTRVRRKVHGWDWDMQC